MSQHVPAWKKIGLKLKYAKDTADDTPISTPEPATTNGTSHAGAKRPRDDEPEPSNGSSKKKNKRSKPQDEISTDVPVVKGILSGSQSPTKTPAKKSVQFSAETKAEDGETGQNYFKAWVAGGQPHTPPKPSTEIAVPETPESAEKAQESPADSKARSNSSKNDSQQPTPSQPTTNDDSENGPSLSERRAAKAAKKAAKQSLKARTQPQQPAQQPLRTAYVQYLHQFAHDKPSWKFNKSKENHLLKSLWSTYRVPASYTPAVVSYVAGLQGAGARSRLVEGADEVLRDVAEKGGRKFEFSGYEEAETRREAYGGAVKGLRKGGMLSGEDAERAERAEAVLAQLLNHAPVPVAKPTTVTGAGGAKRIQFADEEVEEKVAEPKAAAAAKLPARRKRKARTDVSSDESSSDSSSSESESESDSSDDASDSDDSSSQSSSEDDSESDDDSDSD